LTAFIIEAGRGKFVDPDATAKAVRAAAKGSYRLPKTVNDTVNQAMSVSIASMRALKEQVKVLDKAIEQQFEIIPNTLTSIPGIGKVYSAGIIAEIILKSGEYTNVKKARLAFSIAPLCTLGNWLPIFISRNEYIKRMLEQGYDQEFIDKMLSVMPNWIIVVMAIVGIIGAYIGCSIGMAFLKKHFKKTGMEK